jgi:hypothetical protein
MRGAAGVPPSAVGSFNARGKYLSYFEEVHGSDKVWGKGVLSVRQRGSDLHATGTDTRLGRETDVHAKVANSGTIVGSYGRRNRVDPAKGALFLEPDPILAGVYRGFYAGYDFGLHRLAAGRYVWRRLLRVRVVKLRPASSDLVRAKALLGRCLEPRYVSEAMFASTPQIAASTNVILGARVGRIIAGAIIADAAPEEITSILSEIERISPTHDLSLQDLGVIRALAVSADMRMSGIGTLLLRGAASRLRKKSCTAVLCLVWRPRPPDNAPLSRFSSTPKGVDWSFARDTVAAGEESAVDHEIDGLLEAEDYDLVGWLPDALSSQGSCPRCGEACRCVGAVYVKTLDHTG